MDETCHVFYFFCNHLLLNLFVTKQHLLCLLINSLLDRIVFPQSMCNIGSILSQFSSLAIMPIYANVIDKPEIVKILLRELI